MLDYRQQLSQQQAQRSEAAQRREAANQELADASRMFRQSEQAMQRYLSNPRWIPLERNKLAELHDECRKKLDIASWKLQQAAKFEEEADAGFQALRDRLVERLRMQLQILQRSLGYIDKAESALLALGFQARHVRRLFLERAKFSTAMARILLLPFGLNESDVADAAVAAMGRESDYAWPRQRELLKAKLAELAAEAGLFRHLSLAWSALRGLEATSAGDEFWLAIHRRQSGSLEQAQRDANVCLIVGLADEASASRST